jgi:hypothetical protein
MKTTTLINEFLSIDPRNRNAGRLLLTHQARLQENLLNACRKYFDSSCAGRSCFEDLREFLPQISFEEQREYIAHINNAAETQRPTRNADENPVRIHPLYLCWEIICCQVIDTCCRRPECTNLGFSNCLTVTTSWTLALWNFARFWGTRGTLTLINQLIERIACLGRS